MMPTIPLRTYKFGDFEFDSERLALYHGNELLKVEKKALQVLAILIANPRLLISTQEIIDTVWSDNPIGVTSIHLAQSISKLRKILADHDPGVAYIETVKGRGYMFSCDAVWVEDRTANNAEPVITATGPDDMLTNHPRPVIAVDKFANRPRIKWVGLAIGGLSLVLIAAWAFSPMDNDAEVRRVVKESQMYESLVLYRDPAAFKESDLDKYWTAETDPNSNYDRQHIRAAVRKLIEDGRRYGSESKNEQFEFETVEISVNGEMAVVKTLEKWFIAEYKTDGTLLRNKHVGPYFVSYVLRKQDGRWLIEKSTTARANAPTPSLDGLELVSEPLAGKEFFVRLNGRSFDPTSIFVRVTGPGCPEARPCSVPNSAILIYTTPSENLLDRVPLTLASGTFKLYVQNGESPPSNPVSLNVP